MENQANGQEQELFEGGRPAVQEDQNLPATEEKTAISVTHEEDKEGEQEETGGHGTKRGSTRRAKDARIAFSTALIELGLERKTVEAETRLGNRLNTMINGGYPEGWPVLNRYFESKGYTVPNLDLLTMPEALPLNDVDGAKRRLLTELHEADLDEEQVAMLAAALKSVQNRYCIFHSLGEGENLQDVLKEVFSKVSEDIEKKINGDAADKDEAETAGQSEAERREKPAE